MASSSLIFSRSITRRISNISALRGGCMVQAQRHFNGVPRSYLCTSAKPLAKKEWYEVTYERADGVTFTVQGKEGDNLLDIAINNDIDLEGFGACEGTLACSTCHLVFSKEDFDKIEDPCTDEELDMLDLAYGLSDTSRLGCQVCLTKKLHGMKVKVPEGTADARDM